MFINHNERGNQVTQSQGKSTIYISHHTKRPKHKQWLFHFHHWLITDQLLSKPNLSSLAHQQPVFQLKYRLSVPLNQPRHSLMVTLLKNLALKFIYFLIQSFKILNFIDSILKFKKSTQKISQLRNEWLTYLIINVKQIKKIQNI